MQTVHASTTKPLADGAGHTFANGLVCEILFLAQYRRQRRAAEAPGGNGQRGHAPKS